MDPLEGVDDLAGVGDPVLQQVRMATVDVMDLFTGLTLPIRIAQVSVVGMVVAEAALVATTVRQAQRDSASIRVVSACAAIALAAVVLGAWAWIWRVLL